MGIYFENIINFDNNKNPHFINVQSYGETFPNPNYDFTYVDSTSNVIEYIVSGRGYLELDGKVYHLHEGDCCIIRKESQYRYYSDKEAPCHKKWIKLKGQLIDKLFDELGFSTSLNIRTCDVSKLVDIIKNIIVANNIDQNIQCAELYSNIFKLLLYISYSKPSLDYYNSVNVDSQDIADDIRFFIENRLQDDFSLELLAKHFFVSKPQIIKVFKEKYKISPYQYYTLKRIDLAKVLLENTDITIEDISARLSFNNRNHFSKVFMSLVGESPAKYRKAFMEKKLQEQE